MDLYRFLFFQNELQREHMKDGSPLDLDPEARADFIRWNHTALIAELGEMLNEVGWKPWASSRHVNAEAALRELVDAWHFFMNLMLAVGGSVGWTEIQIADLFSLYYLEKREKNIQRQQEGYDGVSSKCPRCHRELSETSRLDHVSVGDVEFCSAKCAREANIK